MPPATNVHLSDASVVLNGLQQLTIILGVILGVYLLLRKFIPNRYKNLVLLLVGLWIITVVFQYAFSTYNYFHVFRPAQREYQRQSQRL